MTSPRDIIAFQDCYHNIFISSDALHPFLIVFYENEFIIIYQFL